MTSALSPIKLYRYQKERFPLGAYIILVLLTMGVAGLDRLPEVEAITTVAALLLFVLFFFRLRLFDEIKDYDIDVKYRPERIVARGEVSLSDVRIWLGLTILLEVLLLLLMPWEVIIWYLVAALWSGLMYFEFFAPVWLNRRFLLYSFVHLIVMLPLALAMRAAFGGGPLIDSLSAWIAGGITGMTAIFEIGRKLRRADEEAEGVDTYSKHLGVYPATMLLLAVLAATHIMLGITYSELWIWLVATGLGFGGLFAGYVFGSSKPLNGPMEKLTGAYMMVFYAGLIVTGWIVYHHTGF